MYECDWCGFVSGYRDDFELLETEELVCFECFAKYLADSERITDE